MTRTAFQITWTHITALGGFVFCFLAGANVLLDAQEKKLSPGEPTWGEPTWQAPTAAAIRATIEQWSESLPADATRRREQLHIVLKSDEDLAREPLDNAAAAISLLFPETATLIAEFGNPPPENGAPWQPPAIFAEEALPATVRETLCLLAGRWLTRHARYDEALDIMEGLQAEQMIDPAALLYFRGLAAHRVIEVDQCKESLRRLLENEAALPRRFADMARLMIADVETLESESLDEVSRMMEDIGRRQLLGRSGTRVIDAEESVIATLDKLIDQAEQELQQQQEQRQSSQPSAPSSPPMDESRIAGGRGTGEAADRRIVEGGAWGNLPPRERAAALVEMTRDLPPHYREVVEEYFRQLARQEERHAPRNID